MADDLPRGETGGLTQRERMIVAYASELTIAPQRISEAHVAALRNVGLDDRAIHDLVQVAAYFAYVNRIALGLGVELPPDETLGAWPAQ